MASRPTERALVARLLESEADSVEELAGRVIDALDEDRRKRPTYTIRVSADALDRFLIGSFPTRNDAIKAGKAIAPHSDEDMIRAAVVKIGPTDHATEIATDAAVALSYCLTCRHPMATHDWPKKMPGCIITGCVCGGPDLIAA